MNHNITNNMKEETDIMHTNFNAAQNTTMEVPQTMYNESKMLTMLNAACAQGVITKPLQISSKGNFINLRCACPSHEDNNPSAFIVAENGREYYKCRSCGFRGDIISLTKEVFSLNSDNDAVKKLQELDIPISKNVIANNDNASVLKEYLNFTNNLLVNDTHGTATRKYLEGRNIDLSILKDAPIGVSPTKELFDEWVKSKGYTDNDIKCLLNAQGRLPQRRLLFFYKTLNGCLARIKTRVIDANTRTIYEWLGSSKNSVAGLTFTLSPNLIKLTNVMAVEGEIDVLASISAIKRYNSMADYTAYPVASFGSGTFIAESLKELNAMGTNVSLFPDNDDAGLDYCKIAATAHPYITVLLPEDYTDNSDPAEYFTNHSWESIANAYKKHMQGFLFIAESYSKRYLQSEHTEDKRRIKDDFLLYGRNLNTTDKEQYVDCFAKNTELSTQILLQEIEQVQDKEGFWASKEPAKFGMYKAEYKIANVILNNLHNVVEDDGEQKSTNIGFTAHLYSGSMRTAEIVMNCSDYTDNKKFNTALTEALGGLATINGNRNIELAREALQSFSKETTNDKTIRTALGWDDSHDNFFLANCIINKDGIQKFNDIKIEEQRMPSFIKHYRIENDIDTQENYEEALKVLVDDILKVYPYRITLPIFTFIMSSVVYSFIPTIRPTLCILLGPTGSFKSTYTKTLTSIFGDFVDASLISWSSTAKAISELGSYPKDCIYVVDDLKPCYVKEQDFVSIVQSYGDKQGRTKLDKNSNIKSAKYIRGNFLATGEDLASITEESTTARTLILQIAEAGNKEHLANAQAFAATKKLPVLLVRFIKYLINNQSRFSDAVQEINALRRSFSANHNRTNESCAMLQFMWNLLNEVFPLSSLNDEFTRSLKAIERSMSDMTTAHTAGVCFAEIIRELVEDKTAIILDGNSTPGIESNIDPSKLANTIGWFKDGYAYILPGKAMTMVQQRLRTAYGKEINNTMPAIYGQLKMANYIKPDKNCNTTKQRNPWDSKTINVLRFYKDKIVQPDLKGQ